jgi:hypothetical protein
MACDFLNSGMTATIMEEGRLSVFENSMPRNTLDVRGRTGKKRLNAIFMICTPHKIFG